MSSRNHTAGDGRGVYKVALVIGFLALAFGVLQANAHRPTGYELSIYGGTPVGFWIGVGIAIAISLLVSFAVLPGQIRTTALILGGLSIISIAGLPVLRGYYYYGTADALTHLGWTRDIATGVMTPTELFYPGIHSFAVVFSSFTGIPINRSILFVVVAMTALVLVFVPLAVRVVGRDKHAVVVAAFSTFLLFMIHNMGVYLHAHSFALATFFSALVLFLVFTYLVRRSWLPIGALLAIVSISVILFHPQQAANLILVFGVISVLQFLHRRYLPDHPISEHRSLYAHTVFLGGAFVLWISQFEGWAFYNVTRVENAVLGYLGGRPPAAGGRVQTQAASLSAIGSGLPEMFVKLFFVAAIFSAMAGVLMAASILGRADESRPTSNAVAEYLAIGSLAILPIIGIYFAGNIAEHYFRHIGFLLLIATIVGSLALSRGISSLSRRSGQRLAATIVVIAFAILLPLSLASAFPTPFIHKQSQHVTEAEMDGYDTVFELNDETMPLAGIRAGPWRFSDGIRGVEESRQYEAWVSNENLTRLGDSFNDGGYLVVTEYDREREVRAYQQLRYQQQSFDSITAQPGVNRVVSNGALRLYHVPEGG